MWNQFVFHFGFFTWHLWNWSISKYFNGICWIVRYKFHIRSFVDEYFLSLICISRKREISWKILILHSLISTEDQQLIFQQVENGVRKIILSTNIAESSITVPDVKYGKIYDGFALINWMHFFCCGSQLLISVWWNIWNAIHQKILLRSRWIGPPKIIASSARDELEEWPMDGVIVWFNVNSTK